LGFTSLLRILCETQTIQVMPGKNKNADRGEGAAKAMKIETEHDNDDDGKQDDCSDLTDNNHETDESTSKSFPQKVSFLTLFLLS
jgi:hypothetical protein